ncbi:acyl--CoA ligase [Metallosphaera javensis (ex Sakai et al. 2022)]|uniref:acyl--CoA ligase n=1 Tax=Metallosphaera javensis (ex Sakai et al. 2022) TaxID=2775498 RepID=UPI0025839F90
MVTVREFFRKFIEYENSPGEESLKDIAGMMGQLNLRKFNWVRDVFEEIHVKERGGKTALVWRDMNTGEEAKISYHELSFMSNRVLNTLRKHGLKKGDVVYLMTKIHPMHWAVFLAVIKGGFVMVPSATNLTVAELKYRFSDLKPNAVIADSLRAHVVEEALGSLKTEKFLIDGKRETWNSLEEESGNAEAEDTRGEDVIINYFTSGTTGMPKRVIHTAVSYPVGSVTTASIIGVRENDLHLNLSATGWAKFAWSSFFSPLLVGATIAAINYEGKLDSKRYLEEVEEMGVTSFCAPPTAWRQFITLDLNQFKFERLRSVVSAGEPLNPEVIKTWKDKFNLTIRDFYGQTETTAMIGNFPFLKVKPGSMGKPHPLYDVRLLDDEGKEITRPYEVGHITVRLTPRPIGLFLGYSDERKNMESFREGYYYTGDKAYFDEEGYFYFVGRGDDVIKTSDYRVGPFEVESALLEHPAVAEAAVVGVPDPVRWQLVKAFIVLKKGYNPSKELAEEIREKVKTLLSPYKVPRIIEFVDELPKTISGKIRRVELRKREEEKRKKGEVGQNEFTF